MAHTWAPVEDYRLHEVLAHNELGALAQVWADQRDRLTEQQAYRDFEERLKREWAIETGLIERLYTLDRGITQLLIERGLRAELVPNDSETNPEAIIAMILDHKDAVESVFSFVKNERPLSTSYVKEVHALMTRHQHYVEALDLFGKRTQVPLLRGDFKQMPNNPYRQDGSVHEYCPPEHVAAEMDRLLEMHHAHVGIAPEVEAAWLHHRFAQIHPFQDGNGRVARTLATLIFVRAGWFPLVVRDRDRAWYIDALEDADSGNLKPLVDYFSRLQKDGFIQALSIAEDVIESRRVEDAIKSARQQLQRRRDALVAEWNSAKSIADSLRNYAEHRLKEVADELRNAMRNVLDHSNYFADGSMDGHRGSHYYRYQIIQTARKLDYYADMQSYRSWARLVMPDTNQSELLISFHGIGHTFRGVLACSATWFQRVETEEGERDIGPVVSATDNMFQINYKESIDTAQARFSDWLEDAIVVGLKLWQETAV